MPASPVTVNVDTKALAEELRAEAEAILSELLKVPRDHTCPGIGRFVECVMGAAVLMALNNLPSLLQDGEAREEGTKETKDAAPKTRSWYGTCGALMADQPIPGVAEDPLTLEEEEFYGAPYLVAESMTEQAAEAISGLLGLDYCGRR